MFLERHSYIYDPLDRQIDLGALFKDSKAPGWNNTAKEWDDTFEYPRCYVGWMAMYNNYYMALLGTIGGLKIQNCGRRLGDTEDPPIIDIQDFVGPLPSAAGAGAGACIIL